MFSFVFLLQTKKVFDARSYAMLSSPRFTCITQRPWCIECLIDFKFSPVQADSPLFSPSMEQSASSNKLVQVTDL